MENELKEKLIWELEATMNLMSEIDLRAVERMARDRRTKIKLEKMLKENMEERSKLKNVAISSNGMTGYEMKRYNWPQDFN